MKKLISICVIIFYMINCTPQEKKEASTSPKKPNIIFIFADDQAYKTIQALGNTEIKTPNLDNLIKSGTAFTNAYNMGAWNGAVCQASRAMLNTGKFVWNAYKTEEKQQEMVERGEMWPQLMKKAGYNTYMSGKWHVKTPATKIFDVVKHVRPPMPKDFFNHTEHMRSFKDSVQTGLLKAEEIMPYGYNRPLSVQDTSWLPWDKSNGGFWEGGTHWSEVLANDAIGFIEDAKGKTEPFFMYLAFNAAHDPRQAPKEYVDMYPLENISVPENFAPGYSYANDIGCGPQLRDAALAPFPRTEFATKVHRQEYYALISHMDAQIGKIIDALKASGEMDNTYIFYTADHGLAVGEHGFFGKQNMYEHSISVPLFIIGPDIPQNMKLNTDVYLQDIMPSTLELAGIEKPDYVEFNSLLPITRGNQNKSHYNAVYGCYKKDLQRMIKKDGFKLILYPQIKVARLYHLENDPLEMNDLASKAEYKEKLETLYQDLLKLQKQMHDPLDLKAAFGKTL